VVKPTWRGYEPEPGQIVIEIDPGMAFGSGTHPTTRLCLALIEQRHQVDWVALAARRAEPA
jgi:ribosomal protein L11 methyltransferase